MELRNCPFCGGPARMTYTNMGYGPSFWATCMSDCRGGGFASKQSAADDWNRRGDDGRFPAFLTQSQAWPKSYVDGYNEALRLVREEGFGPPMSPRYTITEAGRAMLRDAQQGVG